MTKYENTYFLQSPVVTDIEGDGPDRVAVTLHDDEAGVELKVLFYHDQLEHILSTRALEEYQELEVLRMLSDIARTSQDDSLRLQAIKVAVEVRTAMRALK